ncbi:MAG: hypothetical protein R3Y60_01105 [bacterium]
MINKDIPKLASLGVISSLIGQYVSDIILNIFFYNKSDFLEIITSISPLPLYYASTISGFFSGSISENVDVLTNAAFRNVLYVYFNAYYSKVLNEEDIIDNIDVEELIQDTIAIIILLYTIDEYTRESYKQFKENKRNGIKQTQDKRTIESTIIVTFITNAYAFYKLSNDDTNQIDRSIDI